MLLSLALPISLQSLVTFLVNLADNVMVGGLREVDISAVHMSRQMATVLQCFMNGIGTTMLVLGAQYFGKKSLDAIKRIIFNGFRVTVILGLLYSAFNIVLARQILGILTNGNEAVVAAGTCYRMVGLSGLVKSGGDTAFVTINDSIHVFLIIIPSAYLCYKLGAPVWAVFLCLKCDQLLKCIVAVVKINRFRWMKKPAR